MIFGFFSLFRDKPLGGVLCIISGLLCAWVGYSSSDRGKTNAQLNAELEQEKRYAQASQNSNVPWNKRYFTEPCPYCNHYKVRYATWDDKKMSVAFWGIWSSKVGANFHCDCCGKAFSQ